MNVCMDSPHFILMEKEIKSIFEDACEYYFVSRSETILKDKECKEAYRDLGCYVCSGVNDKCVPYLSWRKNYEVRHLR
jgi:hypothetical protein